MKDKYGFIYYNELPGNTKKVENIYEFITIDPSYFDFYYVNVGQKYLIYNSQMQVYELYEITEYTIDTQLLSHLKQGNLYLVNSHGTSEKYAND